MHFHNPNMHFYLFFLIFYLHKSNSIPMSTYLPSSNSLSMYTYLPMSNSLLTSTNPYLFVHISIYNRCRPWNRYQFFLFHCFIIKGIVLINFARKTIFCFWMCLIGPKTELEKFEQKHQFWRFFQTIWSYCSPVGFIHTSSVFGIQLRFQRDRTASNLHHQNVQLQPRVSKKFIWLIHLLKQFF